jgi:hypothetical protein
MSMRILIACAVACVSLWASSSEAAGPKSPRGVAHQRVEDTVVNGRRQVPRATVEIQAQAMKRPLRALHKSTVSKIAATVYHKPL